jgi:hypothetical protein
MIVSFATAQGETVRFQDNADYLHSHEVGQAVEVLYARQRPSVAVVHKFNSLWLKGYHLALIGSALWLIAYFAHKAVKAAGQPLGAQP